MKKWLVLTLLLFCMGVNAQSKGGSLIDAERLRISADRERLNAAFAIEETACYQRFFVNNCLDEVKARLDDGLADLRRQEIVLNEESRQAKATPRRHRLSEL